MHRSSRVFVVAIVAALSIAVGRAAQAQGGSATSSTAPSAISVMRAAHGVSELDGELWALGPDYKARFRERGVEFHPALGDAPRNFPIALELESIRRDEPIPIERAVAPQRVGHPPIGELLVDAAHIDHRDGDGSRVASRVDGSRDRVARDAKTVRFERAPGIEERYESRVDGLEQSFVFARRPRGSGDLVVRMHVESELVAPIGESDALEFTQPQWGGVRIGAVTGIDAIGRTAAGRLRWDGAALELVLPAEFVDTAAYPLVLDPLIGTAFLVASTSLDEGEPDVAFSAASSRYFVVWHRKISSTDYDVVGQLVNTAGLLVGNSIALENSALTIGTFPSVVNVHASNSFLVAWDQQGTGGNHGIYARSVALPSAAVSAPIPLFAGASNDAYPILCGERTSIDDEVYVVCQRSGVGIIGGRVVVPIGANPALIQSTVLVADANAARPTIAKSFGDGGRALIVFTYVFSASDFDLYALLIDRDGTVLVATTPFATTLDSEYEAAVDGDGTNFIVAYTRKPNPTGDTEIDARRVTYAPPTLTLGPVVPLTNDTNSQSLPAVAWTPGKAFVAWQQSLPQNPTDVDLYVEGIASSDCKTCESIAPLDLSLTWDTTPSLASQYSGGSAGDQVFATWYSGELLTFLEKTNVKGQLLEAFGPGGAVVDEGGACGGGGVTELASGLSAGNPNFGIRVSGASASATIGFLYVSAIAPPLSCGTCSVVLSGAQFPMPLFNGGATKSLPMPCDANIVGVDVLAQWVVFPTSASPCALFGSALASNRLRLTVGQ